MTDLVRSESLTGYCQLVESLGGDYESLLAGYDLSRGAIETEGYMFPYRSFVCLIEETARNLNCPDFGIRCAQLQDFSVLGPIALAAQQSDVLAQALERVSNYLHVYTPALSLSVSMLPGGQSLILGLDIRLDPMPDCVQVVELNMALSAKIIHMLSGGRSKPLKLMMPHSPVNSSRVYRKSFPCDIEFNQGMAAYEMKSSDLNLPLLSELSELGGMAYSYLEAHFLPKKATLPERVAALIKPLLMADQCDNQSMASALNMEVRQLHRLLEADGLSFRRIKDKVMKELAEMYLKEKNIKLGQIARILGYAEQSAFSRSCQRWFGMGPRDYRKQLLG